MTDIREDRTTRGGKRRQEILDAAAAIFAEKGYEATSIQDIAEAVDILKGSLYYYVNSKEDLLFEVIEEVHEAGLANMKLQQAQDDATAPLDRLRRMVIDHVTYNSRNIEKIAVFFHDFRSLTDERKAHIIGERDLYDRRLRDILEAGKKTGEICPGLDVKLASFALLGMMNWVYHWFRPGGPATPEQVAEAFAEMAVRSVACPGGDHAGHRA
jgi:AcrR family transcriptional regulator